MGWNPAIWGGGGKLSMAWRDVMWEGGMPCGVLPKLEVTEEKHREGQRRMTDGVSEPLMPGSLNSDTTHP